MYSSRTRGLSSNVKLSGWLCCNSSRPATLLASIPKPPSGIAKVAKFVFHSIHYALTLDFKASPAVERLKEKHICCSRALLHFLIVSSLHAQCLGAIAYKLTIVWSLWTFASLALSRRTSFSEAIRAGPVLTHLFEVAGWAFLKLENLVLFLCVLLRQIFYNSISFAVLTAIKLYVQPTL